VLQTCFCLLKLSFRLNILVGSLTGYNSISSLNDIQSAKDGLGGRPLGLDLSLMWKLPVF